LSENVEVRGMQMEEMDIGYVEIERSLAEIEIAWREAFVGMI